jgi:hypothetical protein
MRETREFRRENGSWRWRPTAVELPDKAWRGSDLIDFCRRAKLCDPEMLASPPSCLPIDSEAQSAALA